MQTQVSLLVIYPCCMTFRWETANTLVVQPATAPAAPQRKIFSKTIHRGESVLPFAESSVLGIQCLKEGTSSSLIVFHNGDKPGETSLFCTLKNSVLGVCKHLRMKLQGWQFCTWAMGLVACLHSPAHPEIHPVVTLALLPGPPCLGITGHCARKAGETLL